MVLSGLVYPVTMMHYFWNALERRQDVDLRVAGPFTGAWIPWNGGMVLQDKYVKYPAVPLPQGLIGRSPDPSIVEKYLPWKPDLWIQVDAGFHFNRRPNADCVIGILTDPHAILKNYYDELRKFSDITFCMQTPYMEGNDRYLAYAFDPTIHYPDPQEKVFDGSLIGLHYEQRNQLVKSLRNLNYKIYYDIGKVYDEYRQLNNSSKIALSWSSLQDLPTRVFEAMGMNLPLLTNRIPDLSNFFVENEHYVGFSNLGEAVEKFTWMIMNYEKSTEIADNAYRKVLKYHTWDYRIQQIFETCKVTPGIEG